MRSINRLLRSITRTLKRMLEISYWLPCPVVKHFPKDGVESNSKSSSFVLTGHMNNIDAVCQDRQAMRRVIAALQSSLVCLRSSDFHLQHGKTTLTFLSMQQLNEVCDLIVTPRKGHESTHWISFPSSLRRAKGTVGFFPKNKFLFFWGYRIISHCLQ